MLCLNDSFFFLKPIVVSQKEKKKVGGGGGAMLGLWDLRTGFLYRLLLYIRLLDHNTLKICYFVNLDHSFF